MKLIKKVYHKIDNKIFDFCRKFRLKMKKRHLKNYDVTILCSDCIGGVIYHDFNLRFNSPTINLYIKPSEFVKFCKNLDFYLNCKLEQVNSNNRIIGKLKDINIVFLHYSSYKEAEKKWNERVKRINKNNMCLIMTCKDGYTPKDIKDFDSLSFKNKIVFTPSKYNKYNSSYYIKGSDKGEEIKFLGTKTNHFGKKIIDDFDIVSFLNKVGE